MSLFAEKEKEAIITARLEKAIHDVLATDAEQQRIKELRWRVMGEKAFIHRYGRGQFRDDDKYDDDEYDN